VPEAPYPLIYWPAAASEENASEIVVRDAASPRTYDFRLPREFRSAVAKGIVLLPDGRPAAHVQVWIMMAPDKSGAGETEACCAVVDQTVTDEGGGFGFTAELIVLLRDAL
jgi:hypothetical protein